MKQFKGIEPCKGQVIYHIYSHNVLHLYTVNSVELVGNHSLFIKFNTITNYELDNLFCM